MTPRPPRPYIKSASKLDFHIAENSGPAAEELLRRIAKFLSSNGFQRRVVKHRRVREQEQTSVDTMHSTEGNLRKILEPKINYIFREGTATVIGSCLRGIALSAQEAQRDGGAVSRLPRFGDGEIVCGGAHIRLDGFGVSGVMRTLYIKLYDIFRSPKCPFYIVPVLSSTLSAELNLPKTSAIGLTGKATELLADLAKCLRPIELASKKLSLGAQSVGSASSSFVKPSLSTPKGKKLKGAKTKKKQQGKRGK